MEIEGEKAYPIYKVGAYWIDVVKPGSNIRGERDKWLPEDRFFDSTGFEVMRREELTEGQRRAFLDGWWNEYRATKDVNGVWLLPRLAMSLSHHETWYCMWFNHFTFDDGRTDHEYLQSFARYVERMKRRNAEARDAFVPTESQQYFLEPHCLMGAEDRLRWKGEDNMPNCVCRCEACRKRGMVAINH